MVIINYKKNIALNIIVYSYFKINKFVKSEMFSRKI